MDWQVKGLATDPAYFSGFEIQHVLIEFDGPRLFTAQTPVCKALFMLIDEDDQAMRFIVAPTNVHIIEQLEQGLMTVRAAVDQALAWVVETDYTYTVSEAWSTTLAELPESVLPQKGIMLWPHLQPAFSLRAIGEGLSVGGVPASVIKQVVDGASTALRKAASHVLNEPSKQGRIKNSQKRLYDLPVQHFAYNSFEVAFRLPEEQQVDLLREDESEMQQIGTALANAIQKSIAPDADALLANLEIELLEALEKLVPPLSGIVTEYEVGGTILSNEGKAFRLDRESSKQVKAVLQQIRGRDEKIATLEGVVAEMDRDNLSFTLRQTSDGKDHNCTFSPEIFDEVMDAFVQATTVAISGRETLKNGNIDVSLFNKAGNEQLQ
ncbi:MAG: hypothetical protein IBX50_19630 [Marinospirillum sp.]|uniref:hypothetical protein n=1 Tax=Marinospirillum sp. TaxID=2183934 RepID=UPI0019E8C3AD|nr:hypothetical protein [Marinospirillum sp.]MBE0508901.1 hypothetical protein [Marinospirillum sp.]